jgi:hypothetical protein
MFYIVQVYLTVSCNRSTINHATNVLSIVGILDVSCNRSTINHATNVLCSAGILDGVL